MSVLVRAHRLIGFLALLVLLRPAAGEPDVVVSIQPLHALAAAVMAGTGEPHLVVRGQGSPHTYRMRPSDARALAGARLVVWLGPELETFLVARLGALARDAEILQVSALEGLVRHPARAGGVWDAHRHEAGDGDGDRGTEHETGHEVESGHRSQHGHEDGHEHEVENGQRSQNEHEDGHGPVGGAPLDPHLWLDPRNSMVIAQAIADVLAAIDPSRAALYQDNARALALRIGALDDALAATLDPVREVPYAVLHDAYQYLERRYGLLAVGAVTVSPDRMPSARRVVTLRRRLRALGARCVFGEPQVDSPLLASLAEGEPPLTVGVLDPLGAAHPPGPEAYFRMMESNARALSECLGPHRG